MKIISMAHRHAGATDFGMCIVNDDMAEVHFARCKTANHQGLYSLAMFSPDSPGELLDYIRDENDRLKADMEKDGAQS